MEGDLIMKTFSLIWSPEGRVIATVEAKTPEDAKRMTPQPYKEYLGEVYVIETSRYNLLYKS